MPETEVLFDALTRPISSWDDATLAAEMPAGDGILVLHPEPWEADRGAPAVVGWKADIADLDLATAIEQAERRLGVPHQMTGGPVSLRWWTRDARQVILAPGWRDGVTLRVVPAVWHSESEMADVDLGELRHMPYLWRAEIAGKPGPNGVWTPGSYQPADLDELGGELTRVLEAQVHAATILPDRYMARGSLRVANPNQRLGESGLPYYDSVEVAFETDPWKVRFLRRQTAHDQAEGDPATDLPAFTERLISEMRAWELPAETLEIWVFAEGRVPGKKAPKRRPWRTRFTTLGGAAT